MEPLKLLDIVINAMERVEQMKGSNKKKTVALTVIKNSIISIYGKDVYELYQTIIPTIIEMIICLSKNQFVMEINKKIKNKCLKFCK